MATRRLARYLRQNLIMTIDLAQVFLFRTLIGLLWTLVAFLLADIASLFPDH